ncbi:MAG: sodium/proline symporter [candidate division Zixibacteria bacterium]|nr:sodium/proline symporter [candidate division Zixibacteria bacterium]
METSWSLAISFIIYTVGIVAVGLYSAKYASRSTSDYLLARKGLGAWVTAISASASSESGWVTLGLVGTAFNEGLAAIWVAPGCLLGYLFNWWVMARPIQKFSSEKEVYTIPDLLVALFKEKALAIRWISVIVIFFMMTAYVGAQFNAAGKAFEAVFHIKYELGVLIGVLIVVVYTVSGGFRAVAWTDFVQGILMWVALIFLPILVISQAGGFGEMFATLESYDAGLVNITSKKVGFAALGLIVGWLGIGLGYPGQPHVLLRFMATKDQKAITKGRIIAMVWGIFVFTGAVFLGLATRAVFGSLGDAEQALPIIAIQLLPGVLAGLMLAAVLAAICSTADSQLLVASSSISHDLYARLTGKDLNSRHVINIDRLAVVVLGILSMILALTANRVIFSFVLYAWAGLGAAFAPPLILGLLWKKTTGSGAIAGMIVGFTTVVIWKNIPALSGALYELVPAFFLSMVAVWLVSLLTGGKK